MCDRRKKELVQPGDWTKIWVSDDGRALNIAQVEILPNGGSQSIALDIPLTGQMIPLIRTLLDLALETQDRLSH